MNVDYHLYNVMLDCNIQAHILYVINANNTILYYTLYMIILVYTALHKAFSFFYEVLYHTSFFLSFL